MLIREKPLQHWIDHFYGYGSWDAPFWFVSHEDGGGDLPEEVADKINYFFNKRSHTTDATLCDIRDLYQHAPMYWDGPKAGVYANLFEFRFGANAHLSNVWKNLINFKCGYRGEYLPDLITYQKNQFAIREEALIKLYPLPGASHHGWYYSWLDLPQFPFLKSRALYEQHLYSKRIQTLFENIRHYKPEVVLMYGMSNINDLKKSFQESFPEVKFKMIKAIKQHTPQYHRGDLEGTMLLITTQIPALRHNREETGFDWLEFGRQLTVNK